MDILLWLVPPAVVTVVAMAWVSWLGREGRGEVDRDVAVRRLGEALERSRPVPGRSVPGRSVPGRSGRGATTPSLTRQPDRSTGIAVRPSRASAPRPVLPSVLPVVAADRPAVEPPDEQSRRRVS